MHPIEHAGRFFTVRGPLNVPRPVQGQPVILHRDVPAGPMRSGAAASAEVVLAECATIAEAAASRRDWRAWRKSTAAIPRAALRRSRDADPGGVRAGGAASARRSSTVWRRDGRPATCRSFVGTPDQFADWLAQWHDAGACDGFDILPAVLPVDLDLLVEAVVPLLAPSRSACAPATSRRRCAAISACGARHSRFAA